MPTVLTSSQQTFVDITDQRKLSAYITSNLPKTQSEDPNVLPHTYAPSWASTNLTLTPVVFLDQTSIPLGSTGLTIQWKRKDGTAAETALTSGESVSGGILTVNQNKLAASSSGMITYICYISYYDSETRNTVNISADITYTLVRNAENAKLAYITSDTYVFKYDTDSSLVGATQATLTGQVQGVTITKWQYKNSSGKAKKNNGKKNKYFQPDHHEAIVSRSMWNAAQRILNSRRYRHEGTYLPMRIIDHGSLSGYVSMNRSWAGFDFEDYYRASQIAMGMLDDELEVDLETEYLPESGRRIGGLVDDHGIAQIARDLTAAEQEIKDELEGRAVEAAENQSKEEAVRAFQVVSGDMFSRMHDPVVRITTKGLTFNSNCVSRLPGVSFVEVLFNPVERMMVVRPCTEDNPNAIPWDPKYKSAAPLTKVVYDSMGWETDYSFRVPCQTVRQPNAGVNGAAVLAFDLDNFVGRATAPKEEVIMAKKEPKDEDAPREDAKSYYYPPDEEEPQEIHDMEARFQEAVEMNRKIFGTPVFQHDSSFRGLNGESDGSGWDMMVAARPLDVTHTVDEDKVEWLLQEIMDDPPPLRRPKESFAESAIVVEPEGQEE